MNNRIKSIRKHFKLSQTAFGEKIGVSRDVVNNLEHSRGDVKEPVIKTICYVFTVNEEWLRTGQGEMFTENQDTVLYKVTELLKLDDTEQKFLSAYLSLDTEQRQNFKEFWRQLVNAYNGQNEIAATKDYINQEVESYRKELEAEHFEKTLLVSEQLKEDLG